MGRYRRRVVDVNLNDGQEIRVADAPVSEPLKKFAIYIESWRMGADTPLGAGDVTCSVYLGGGWDAPAQVYSGSLATGMIQGAAVVLPGATTTFPRLLHSETDLLPSDRVREAGVVREDAGSARALHIRNNCAGGAALNCRIVFISETVAESG